MAAALAAALLALAGCGSAGAQTAAPKQAEPKDEAAEFGANLAGLLNNGKSKKLFNLWTGSDDLETEPLADAVMPEAKAKGIEWKYAKGSFGPEEGSVTLKWTAAGKHSSKEFKTKLVDGKWRLEEDPLIRMPVCAPFSVDGTDAPVVGVLGEQGPCYDYSNGGMPKEGQILLLAPGEHSVSVDALKGVVEQPYRAMAYPADAVEIDFSRKPGVREGGVNLVPDKPKLASGYADAVKAAFLKVDYSSCTESASCINGETQDQRDNLFDGITVTPTDDIMHPTIGGTYQHWRDDGYYQRDASKLDWDLTINENGILVGVYDKESTGL